MLHGRTGHHDYECLRQAVTPGGRVAAASSPVSLITGNDHLTVLHSGGQIMEPRADTPLRYGIQTTERSMPHGVSTSNHSQHGHGHDRHGHLHGNEFEAMGHMGIAENQYAADPLLEDREIADELPPAAALVLEDGEIQEYIPLDDEDGLNENDFDENADLSQDNLSLPQDSLLGFYAADDDNHELQEDMQANFDEAADQDLSDFHHLFFQKYDENIKLLDIPFEHLSPSLVLLNKPIEFINSRFRPAIAQLFSKLIAHLLEDKLDPMRWKKSYYSLQFSS